MSKTKKQSEQGIVTIKDFLSATPESLALEQEAALATFVARRLREVADLIALGEYDKVEPFLENSPAGDGWGRENYFIHFSETGLGGDEGACMGAIMARLKQLESIRR